MIPQAMPPEHFRPRQEVQHRCEGVEVLNMPTSRDVVSASMTKHHKKGGPVDEAELERLHRDLVLKLAVAVGTNEKVQRKFRNAVLIRLSKIETMLTEIQGAQLVDFWPPGEVTDEQRAVYLKEVEDRVSRLSGQLGMKMVRYIYGEDEVPEIPRDRRRKWSGWEI